MYICSHEFTLNPKPETLNRPQLIHKGFLSKRNIVCGCMHPPPHASAYADACIELRGAAFDEKK
jgi:hypothetical protein